MPSKTRKTTEHSRLDMRLLSMVFILLGMWILFRWRVGEFYFSGESIAKLSRDMATWTILAAGMTLIIVAGHIDLSVGSLLAVVTASCAYMLDPEIGLGWSATVAVPLALGAGVVLGLWQGLLVALFRVPSFIVTLAGLFMFRGLTQRISAQDPRVPEGSWINALGFGYLPDSVGYALAAVVCVLIVAAGLWQQARRRHLELEPENRVLFVFRLVVPCLLLLAFVYKANQYQGVPAQTLVMGCVLVLLWFVAGKTLFGRRVYAIGGNPEAARLSGIGVEVNTVLLFALMGLLAGVAGVVWMAQNQGSTQKAGEWYELYAIASCVIGGTSLMGGRGAVFGTLLGALVMATVIQGMDYTGLQNWLQLVVRGAVLVLAVGIDVATKNPAPWMQRTVERLRRCWRARSTDQATA
jgi:D-xylose transport system permease protein